MAPENSPRQKVRRRTLVIAVAAAVSFLAGMAARGALGDRADDGAQDAATPGPVSAPAEHGESGATARFARGRVGARDAAVAYTATLSQQVLYLEPADAEEAVRAIAAEASADSLVADSLAALDRAREPLAGGTGPTWWAVRPLAVKVEAYSPQRARLSVWLVQVLSRQGVAVPQSSWVTETVELVWEDGDWRLWSDTTTAGPTPVLGGSDLPASAAELDSKLTGFVLLGVEQAHP
jgi:hypothetical protein